jgi:hypothetical protein
MVGIRKLIFGLSCFETPDEIIPSDDNYGLVCGTFEYV